MCFKISFSTVNCYYIECIPRIFVRFSQSSHYSMIFWSSRCDKLVPPASWSINLMLSVSIQNDFHTNNGYMMSFLPKHFIFCIDLQNLSVSTASTFCIQCLFMCGLGGGDSWHFRLLLFDCFCLVVFQVSDSDGKEVPSQVNVWWDHRNRISTAKYEVRTDYARLCSIC